MKKLFFLALAVISFNCLFAQTKKTEPAKTDTVSAAVPAPAPATEQPKAFFIVGTEQDFQFLESIVSNFKGLSYVEVKPLLDWLKARRELPPADKK